jgi:hypothetical protein
MIFRMRSGSAWLLGLLVFPALPILAQGTGEGTAARQDSIADTAARVQPPLSFLVPVEGDVHYGTSLKVLVRVRGPVPSGLAAVLDKVLLDQPLTLEKGILVLPLKGLQEGVHALRLMYLDERDRIRSTATVRFFVKAPLPEPVAEAVATPSAPANVSDSSGTASPSDAPSDPPKLKQFGRVAARMEWKNDEAASRILSQSELRGLGYVPETDTTYAYDTLVIGEAEAPLSRNLDATVEGTYSARYERWEVDVKGSLSSQENRFRQPMNRLSASVAYGPWAYAKVGDVYPDYNPLIFNGTRVRGAEAGAALVLGVGSEQGPVPWGYAKVVTGQTQRYVPAYIIRSRFDGGYDTAYVPGTRAQNLSAVRVGAGGGDALDIGVTVMKASDGGQDSAAAALNEYLYGPAPSENLVGGLDARAGFWEGKLQVYGQAALSLYTRDRSLGPFSTDTADGSFQPSKYRNILVINPTTGGWEYLVTEGESAPDYAGFAEAASAYVAGVSASLPFTRLVWETDISYNHLGTSYRSEANPFLGGNPGDGWNLQQRLGFLENRLHFGAELSRFLQEFGDYRQLERAFKVEARYATPDPRSALWINAGVSRQTPQGTSPNRYSQSFDEVNLGGSHQQPGAGGTWNLFTQYGYTQGRFRLYDPDPEAPVYPPSRSHAVSSSVSFKLRNSDLLPKVSHNFSDNGVQEPVHSLGLGLQNAFFEKKLRMDGNVLMGEYARPSGENGVSFGQNLALTLRVRPRESFRFQERSSHQGDRVSVIAGTSYERSF